MRGPRVSSRAWGIPHQPGPRELPHAPRREASDRPVPRSPCGERPDPTSWRGRPPGRGLVGGARGAWSWGVGARPGPRRGRGARRPRPAPPPSGRFATAAGEPQLPSGSRRARPPVTEMRPRRPLLLRIAWSLSGRAPPADRGESAAKPGGLASAPAPGRAGTGRGPPLALQSTVPLVVWVARSPARLRARFPRLRGACLPSASARTFPGAGPVSPCAPDLSRGPRVRAHLHAPAERPPGARPRSASLRGQTLLSPRATPPAGKRPASTGMASGVHE